MATKESNPVLPLPFQRGQVLRAADLEMLRSSIAFALDGMIGAGPGLIIAKRGSRWIISAERPRNFDNPRTFLVSGIGTANLTVSAGAINNVAYAGGMITAPANGHKVYIDATISGVTVTAVTVASASAVPAASSTHVYKLLATVAVASSIATPTPVGWNFSEMQICAGTAIWGGFGA